MAVTDGVIENYATNAEIIESFRQTQKEVQIQLHRHYKRGNAQHNAYHDTLTPERIKLMFGRSSGDTFDFNVSNIYPLDA